MEDPWNDKNDNNYDSLTNSINSLKKRNMKNKLGNKYGDTSQSVSVSNNSSGMRMSSDLMEVIKSYDEFLHLK